MALPTCECVAGKPDIDKVRDIYCAVRELAGDDPSLTECDCAATLGALLDGIYCGILIWGELNI